MADDPMRRLLAENAELKQALEDKRASHENIAVLAGCLSQRHPGIPGEDIYLLAARLLDAYAAELTQLRATIAALVESLPNCHWRGDDAVQCSNVATRVLVRPGEPHTYHCDEHTVEWAPLYAPAPWAAPYREALRLLPEHAAHTSPI